LIIQASADIQSPFFCPGLTQVSPFLFATVLITTLINRPSCIDHHFDQLSILKLITILINQPSSPCTDNLPCALLPDCDETGQSDFYPFLKSWCEIALREPVHVCNHSPTAYHET